MASMTTHECDGCGVSIPDPGRIGDLRLNIYELAGGEVYSRAGNLRVDLDLCLTCVDKTRAALNKALNLVKI